MIKARHIANAKLSGALHSEFHQNVAQQIDCGRLLRAAIVHIQHEIDIY